MTAREKLLKKFNDGLHICVGLDTDINKIPEFLREKPNALLEFNKAIIEATKSETAAYKINLAFYESLGQEGLLQMEETIKLIPDDIAVIGDAKRGDIGNTSKMYAKSLFDHFKFDCSTLHGYMGIDSLSPFFEYKDKLHFVLCLTSNPGAQDFEKLKLESGKFLYQEVLDRVKEWNTENNLGIVFGATNDEELKANVGNFGDLIVLLPGIGAQKGNLEEVIKAFRNVDSNNYLINISRGIIYAGNDENFAEIAREALISYNYKIKDLTIT
ncbi:MAG: orotidine 5'-phosphate decarboxylase [Melioribacteraceae bacterium]|nr:MAG: orotidine 5'-phosphate decarboxylase [Melioribacteraceae bacterium]